MKHCISVFVLWLSVAVLLLEPPQASTAFQIIARAHQTRRLTEPSRATRTLLHDYKSNHLHPILDDTSPSVDESVGHIQQGNHEQDVLSDPTTTQHSAALFQDVDRDDDDDVSRVFPLQQIVNHEPIKRALVLAAANPRLGVSGILIGGGHGTCKSVLARSSVHLFPRKMERLAGNIFNVEPSDPRTSGGQPWEVDSFLKEHLLSDNRTAEANTMDTETIPTPFVVVPLNVMAESLLGSVDIEQSMETGRTMFSPGLLAKAHRGILYMDDIHLLEDDVMNILMDALSSGFVTVEREGLSVRYPCRPKLVIATCNPEEGDLRAHMVDRFAMSLSSDARPFSVEERVQVVQNVEGYDPSKVMLQDGLLESNSNGFGVTDEDLLENVNQARELLPSVEITSAQIQYLCEQATLAGCEGQRAELFATEIAKTVAALHGRQQVNEEDLEYGVYMAIVPRAKLPFREADQASAADQASDTEVEQQEQQPLELQPLEPDMDHPPPDDHSVDEEEEEVEQTENKEEEESADSDSEQEEEVEEEEIMIPTEFMFGVDFNIPVDPAVLQFHQQLTKKGKGGKHAKIFSTSRGRFVKAIFPKPGDPKGRLALGATLRAAAPHQKLRQKYGLHRKYRRRRKPPKVFVTKDDFRIQRLARKAGTLVIFVVDASGSMALNRMGAAKGAAMLLLKEAYKCRDKIALVAFHGRQADVVVPPTKSMAMTKRRLESMPCGGGSPLAHALETAVRIGLNEIRVKRDVGKVFVVLLTDGRANVPLSASTSADTGEQDQKDASATDGKASNFISSDRKLLRDEVVKLASQVSAIQDLELLCIDTEDEFVGTGVARDVTQAALGTYHHLAGVADTKAVANFVQQGVHANRQSYDR